MTDSQSELSLALKAVKKIARLRNHSSLNQRELS